MEKVKYFILAVTTGLMVGFAAIGLLILLGIDYNERDIAIILTADVLYGIYLGLRGKD